MSQVHELAARLQVVYAWQRHLLGHRLLAPKDRLVIGPVKNAAFATPGLPGAPGKLVLLKPMSGGFRLTLAPGMSGWVQTRVLGRRDVREILAQPMPKRWFGNSALREVDLWNGDSAVVVIDEPTNLRLQLSFVDPPEHVPRPDNRRDEPLIYRITSVTSALLAALVALLLLLVPGEEPGKVEITQERFARYIEPELATPKMKQARSEAKKQGEKKRKEKEAAMSKRAKDREGKLGRPDRQGETTLPQGKKDILRDKVAQVGVLGLLGRAKGGGSGLGKLLDTEASNEMEQAVTGLAGAKLAVGSGSGGLGSAGTGLGGGGTGFGNIQGSGNLAIGAGRGSGRRGTGLGSGKEREVSGGLKTGTPDADGGLTAEQINRVVMSHKAALQYCYEKELQRKPQLSGKIELRWLIRQNGDVDQVKIATSTMGDKDVEGCMQRQVKNWRFPKATQPTLVSRYPFLFKGGT